MRPKIFAPRALACSARSSTSTAAPSPMTKPSRRASNGRETPSRESAPMRRNAARQTPVSADAHGDHARRGVGHHHRHEVRRHRALAALEEVSALALEREQPAHAGADEHAEALAVEAARGAVLALDGLDAR